MSPQEQKAFVWLPVNLGFALELCGMEPISPEVREERTGLSLKDK